MEFDDRLSPYGLRGPHDNERRDPFVDRLLHPLSIDFIHLIEEEKRNSSNSYRRTSARTAPAGERQNISETSKPTEKPEHGHIHRVSYDAGIYTDRAERKEDTVSGFASLPYFTLGTALQATPAILDRAAIRSATLAPDSLLGTWATHSKNAKEYQTLINGIQTDSNAYRAATIQIDVNRPKTLELEQKVQKILDRVHSSQKTGNLSPLTEMKLEFLQKFLKTPTKELLESALGTGEEVLSANKAFLHDAAELPLFEEYAAVSNSNGEAMLNKAQAAQRITQAKEAAAKLATRVDELAVSQLKKGLLYSGASICAGYMMDGFLGTMFGYEPKNNPVRLFFDGIVVPTTMQAPFGRFKPIALISAESIARITAAIGS